jgi:hypothetical protein
MWASAVNMLAGWFSASRCGNRYGRAAFALAAGRHRFLPVIWRCCCFRLCWVSSPARSPGPPTPRSAPRSRGCSALPRGSSSRSPLPWASPGSGWPSPSFIRLPRAPGSPSPRHRLERPWRRFCSSPCCGAEIAVGHGIDRVLVHGAWCFRLDAVGEQETGLEIMLRATRASVTVDGLARQLRLAPTGPRHRLAPGRPRPARRRGAGPLRPRARARPNRHHRGHRCGRARSGPRLGPPRPG